MIDRDLFLDEFARIRTDEVVIYTMSSAKHWPQVSSSPLDLYIGGAMGYASSVGLGVALARPDRRVVILDGDGSLLMNLGSTVTIAHAAPANLVHVLFQNDLYELSGRVPIPGREHLSFTGLAESAGYASAHDFYELREIVPKLRELLESQGPVLINVRTAPGPRSRMPVFEALTRAPESAKRMAAALAAS
jgi:sulfopyruvate decarboxylase subunit beta